MQRSRLLIAILSLTLILTACSSGEVIKAYKEPTTAPVTAPETLLPSEVSSSISKEDLAKLKVNESGKVMILMYHVIGAPKEANWIQTIDNFKRDLQNLYEQGYSLISLRDLVENNIKVPAGRTPIVFTFDDGSQGHFRYIEKEGEKIIDPESAVGILLDFAKRYPDFGHTATFYVNDRPFGQKEYWAEKLQHLVELGFDIGNHTIGHPKLSKISSEQVQKELAGLAKMVEERVPGYKVDSLALPHGIAPEEVALALKGSHDGYSYENLAVLRVGANPTVAPNVQGFNPARLPRVQASTVEITKWLAYFQNNPEERYISDGDPLTIAVPAAKETLIDKGTLGEKKLVTWE